MDQHKQQNLANVELQHVQKVKNAQVHQIHVLQLKHVQVLTERLYYLHIVNVKMLFVQQEIIAIQLL